VSSGVTCEHSGRRCRSYLPRAALVAELVETARMSGIEPGGSSSPPRCSDDQHGVDLGDLDKLTAEHASRRNVVQDIWSTRNVCPVLNASRSLLVVLRNRHATSLRRVPSHRAQASLRNSGAADRPNSWAGSRTLRVTPGDRRDERRRHAELHHQLGRSPASRLTRAGLRRNTQHHRLNRRLHRLECFVGASASRLTLAPAGMNSERL
jgi:hypothetical protein